jgi:hypothetical protein
MSMAAAKRFLVVDESGDLLLIERRGAEASARIVTRDELRTSYPALAAELERTSNVDTPRVVAERRR